MIKPIDWWLQRPLDVDEENNPNRVTVVPRLVLETIIEEQAVPLFPVTLRITNPNAT